MARCARRVCSLSLAAGLLGLITMVVAHRSIAIPTLEDGLLIPSYSFMILGLGLASNALDRLLSSPGLLLLGDSSYALYLIHAPAWSWFLALGGAPHRTAYLLYAVGIIVLSIGLHLAFERPLQRKLLSYVSYLRKRAETRRVNQQLV
jgi:peptidoglycan/LPS O-acetylase OafA/YrhL